MSRRRNRLGPISSKPSRGYIIFVAVMVGLLVVGSLALVAGTAFFGGDDDPAESGDDTRPGEEIERLQTAVAEDPGDSDSMAVLANILANNGQLQDAVGWYERAVKVDPENGDLRLAFAIALFQLGNDFDAEVQFLRARDLLPDSATPPYYLGQLEERGPAPDLAKAHEWYEEAVGVSADSLVGQQAQSRLDELNSPSVTPTP